MSNSKTKMVFLKQWKYAALGYDVVVCRVGDILYVPNKYVKDIKKDKIARVAKDDEFTVEEIEAERQEKRDAFDESQKVDDAESAKVAELTAEIAELVALGEESAKLHKEGAAALAEAGEQIEKLGNDLKESEESLVTAGGTIAERDGEIVQLKADLETATKPAVS